MRRGARTPVVRRSVGTAVVLMAVGGVLAFGIHAPAVVEEYVDLLDLGLILIWSGLLLLVMQVVMHRPRRTGRDVRPGTTAPISGTSRTCTGPATPARPASCRPSATAAGADVRGAGMLPP